MKRKIITLLLAATLTSSMLLTSCGNQENTSNTQTSINTQQTDDSQKTDDTANNEAPTETPDMILTAETEITDKDLQEIYASIKENITTEYLEPNGISESEFSWPASDSESWDYFNDLYTASYFCINLETDVTKDDLSKYEDKYPSQDKNLFDAVLFGILNWMDSKGSYDTGYYGAVWGKLNPFNSSLPANVSFE